MISARTTLAAALGTTALAIGAPTVGAEGSPDGAPKLARTPTVSLAIIADRQGHHASLAAVVRLKRQLTDRQRRVYGLVAGPALRAGQAVPDALFGGTSLGRIGDKDRHCYAAEVAQLRRHTTVRNGAQWRIGFMDGHTVSAQVRTVTLHRAGDLRAAARSQGCYDT
jgi:hypothetical protein